MLEVGGDQISDPSPTVSFYAGIQNSTNQGRNIQNQPCIYCKGRHSPNECMVVTDLATRKSINSKSGLYPSHIAMQSALQDIGAGIVVHHTTICDHVIICDHQHAHPPPTLTSSPHPTPTGSNNKAALDSGSSTSTQHAQGSGNSNQIFQAEDPVNHQSVLAILAQTQQAVYEYPILLKTAVSQVKVGSTSQYTRVFGILLLLSN